MTLVGKEFKPSCLFRALSDLSVFTSTNRVRSSQSASGFATMFSRSPPTQKADPVSISMFYMPKVRTHLAPIRPPDKNTYLKIILLISQP